MRAEDFKTLTLHLGDRERSILYRSNTADESILQEVFGRKAYDLRNLHRSDEIKAFVEKKAGEGLVPLIIDAGAHIGATAIYYSMVHPGSQVMAIEPQSENFALLEKNTKGLDVRCLLAALGSREGTAEVLDLGHGTGGYRTRPGVGLGCVPYTTLPKLLSSPPRGSYPFILKMDIEGAEQDVFSADAEWVSRFPVIVIELHDRFMTGQGTSRNFLRLMAERDRDFVVTSDLVFSVAWNLDAAL